MAKKTPVRLMDKEADYERMSTTVREKMEMSSHAWTMRAVAKDGRGGLRNHRVSGAAARARRSAYPGSRGFAQPRRLGKRGAAASR